MLIAVRQDTHDHKFSAIVHEMGFKQCEIRSGRQKVIEINTPTVRLPKRGVSVAKIGAVKGLAGNFTSSINSEP